MAELQTQAGDRAEFSGWTDNPGSQFHTDTKLTYCQQSEQADCVSGSMITITIVNNEYQQNATLRFCRSNESQMLTKSGNFRKKRFLLFDCEAT